ncbi:MAG TPA: hypothetical protein VGP46_14610, partial [Acidimicrobiales bacterium]|nr:hypothetical protein [Acidimicrobiales bacterium]
MAAIASLAKFASGVALAAAAMGAPGAVSSASRQLPPHQAPEQQVPVQQRDRAAEVVPLHSRATPFTCPTSTIFL